MLRDEYGPMTVNNYHWGGDRSWSGLRDPSSHYYSPFSQHTYGRAADIIFQDFHTEKVRQDIFDTPSRFPYITGIELATSWLHIDVRNHEGIKKFTN
jgi:hypothetical protein